MGLPAAVNETAPAMAVRVMMHPTSASAGSDGKRSGRKCYPWKRLGARPEEARRCDGGSIGGIE